MAFRSLAAPRDNSLWLTILLFGVQPISYGAWLAFIPIVKTTLDLSKTDLALALLGMPIASVLCLHVASRVIPIFGPRKVLAVLFPVQAVALAVPVLAPDRTVLFLSLIAVGCIFAFMQASLNIYAGRMEKETGQSIMNRCHGAWSVGLMLGSLFAPWLLGLGAFSAALTIGLVSAAAGAYVALTLPHFGAPPGQAAPRRRPLRQIPLPLVLISLLTLAVAMTEGAMADWSAVYLAERLPADSTHFGLGVSIYAGCVSIGRFSGDSIKMRIGAVWLARATFMLAILGLVILAAPLPLWTAFVAFGLIGLGVSVGFPLGVSAVARLDDTYESANIAIMSSIAISGFLIGPPVIGFLADTIGLKIALLALVPGLAIAMVLARELGPRDT